MTPRVYSPPSPSGVIFSGKLGDVLATHASERARHFFLFAFAVDATCRRLKALGGTDIDPAAVVQAKATHQIDGGFRSTHAGHHDFDELDPAVVGKVATGFRRTDAAHYCNLGLDPLLWRTVQTEGLRDPVARDLILLAEKVAGHTRQLPQRVNIGPDRIVDVYHFAAAGTVLRSRTPVFTLANINTYLAGAALRMTDYRAELARKGKLGLAACCDAYLRTYAAGPDAIWQNVSGLIYGECRALRLDDRDYIAR